MICRKCGRENEPEAVICGGCGASLVKKKNNRNTLSVVLCLIAVVLVVALAICLLLSSGTAGQAELPDYQVKARDFVTAYFFNDMEKLEEVCQYDLYGYMESWLDFGEISDSCTVKTAGITACTEDDELRGLSERISYFGGRDDVTAAYEVKVEYEAMCGGDTLSGTATVTVGEIEGAWYVVYYEDLTD